MKSSRSLTLALPIAVGLWIASATVAYAAAPTISNMQPTQDGFVTTQVVKFQAMVTDPENDLDPTRLTLTVDGQSVPGVAYDAATQMATLATPLAEGTHTAVLSATDMMGATVSQTVVFTVDTKAPTVAMTITDAAPKNNKLATTVKLVANDDPQGRASGVKDMQIAFDGAFDNEPWEPFQSTVTRNLMNKEGLQAIVVRVRDRAGNMSDISTATTVLELTPSVTPSNAISSTIGNTVTITWDAVPGATDYIVRYSDGQTLFPNIMEKGTYTVIKNLDLSKSYHFEVAAVNPAGSISNFNKVVLPEQLAAMKAATGTTVATAATGNTGSTANTTAGTDAARPTTETTPATTSTSAPVTRRTTPAVSPSPSPSPTATISPSTTPSPTVTSDQTKQPRDWTRVIVALSILIIAAGVATGGWYLYQWWTARPADKTKNGKKGRW